MNGRVKKYDKGSRDCYYPIMVESIVQSNISLYIDGNVKSERSNEDGFWIDR